MQAADGRVGSPWPEVRARLYVLAILSWASFMQCLDWFTFSSLDASKYEEYYKPGAFPEHASREDVDFQLRLMLNWGPIFGVLAFPAQGWLLSQPDGLRRTLRLGLTLVMLGAAVRFLPSLLAPGAPRACALLGRPWLSLASLHLGQILTACAGPLVMGCASRLSVIWFPEHQRATATAVGTTANAAGVTLGFLLGPWLVPAAGDVPRLLGLELALALVPFVLGALHLPGAPAQPPSAAAAAVAAGLEAPPSFRAGVRLALADRDYGLLILSGGVLAGAGAAWSGVLQDTLAPAGYSDAFVGYLGFANSLALNLGALTSGKLADSRLLRRRFRAVLLAGMAAMLLAGLAWSLTCSTRGASGLLLCLMSAIGLGNGVADPLYYELGAELTYPAPEGTSAGILVLVWNLTSLVMIFLPSRLGLAMNWVYVALILLSLLLALCVKERYGRPLDASAAPLAPDPKRSCAC